MSSLGEVPNCRRGRPLVMGVDQIKMHYVVHYMARGAWDTALPPPSASYAMRIDGYGCRLCGRTFRNNIGKREYPARGSFLCHYAIEHGKLVEALKNETETNVDGVLELLGASDVRCRRFIEAGTVTEYDDDPAEVEYTSLDDVQSVSKNL